MGFMNFLKGLFTPAFLRRLGGAGISGLTDAGLEGYYHLYVEGTPAEGTFPWVSPLEPLPPYDDWAVLGLSAVTWLLGAWKNEKVKEVGEGMMFYSVPMILHHTIVRATWMAKPAAAAPAAAIPATLAERLARKGYTPTKAVQLRNGRYTPTMPGRLGYTPTA